MAAAGSSKPAFAPGDVVMLKSGGATLTVVAVEAKVATCLWFAKDNEAFREEKIPLVALQLVDFADDEDDEFEED